MSEDTMTISKREYDRLLKKADRLERLEAYGVDNWNGYGDTIRDTDHLFTQEEQ